MAWTVVTGAVVMQASCNGKQWDVLTPSKNPGRFSHVSACAGIAFANDVALFQSKVARAKLRSFERVLCMMASILLKV